MAGAGGTGGCVADDGGGWWDPLVWDGRGSLELGVPGVMLTPKGWSEPEGAGEGVWGELTSFGSSCFHGDLQNRVQTPELPTGAGVGVFGCSTGLRV